MLPLIIMGAFSFSAGLSTFFLPETLGAPLPQTIDDAEQFGKRIRMFAARECLELGGDVFQERRGRSDTTTTAWLSETETLS